MAKIETERWDKVLIVSINRPEVRNCVDAETAGLLEEAVRDFQCDDGLRVMILNGRGGLSFCAGADLKTALAMGDRPGVDASGPMGCSRITDVQKPTVAAIEGYCLAGGLELACWCDFRIASNKSLFGVVNRRWGVPLVDGGTQRLPRIVGLGNALYLAETGAMIDTRQALRMGLIQEITPDGNALERALELSAIIAGYPWVSLVDDRRAIYDGLALGLAEGIQMEKLLHERDLTDGEMLKGLDRFTSGQRPQPPRPPQD